jgi:hypothetical protein
LFEGSLSVYRGQGIGIYSIIFYEIFSQPLSYRCFSDVVYIKLVLLQDKYMADPYLSIWPVIPDRKVNNAVAQRVDEYQRLYRVAFADSAGKQLAIQLPDTALRNLVETGAALLGLVLQP